MFVFEKDLQAQVNQNKMKLADSLTGKPMEGPSLTEVVVYGKKPPVNFKLDRQVFKASVFGNAAGGSGLDLLKNLPSMSVNANGDISFRGSSSFLVMVNGKPTQSDPATILSQIPASSIVSIEQITNPSAAFDADGKSGIINIITKKSEQDGWVILANGMIGSSPLKDYHDYRHGDPKRNSADLSVAYKKINGISAAASII